MINNVENSPECCCVYKKGFSARREKRPIREITCTVYIRDSRTNFPSDWCINVYKKIFRPYPSYGTSVSFIYTEFRSKTVNSPERGACLEKICIHLQRLPPNISRKWRMPGVDRGKSRISPAVPRQKSPRPRRSLIIIKLWLIKSLIVERAPSIIPLNAPLRYPT